MFARIETERIRTEYPILDLARRDVELFDPSGSRQYGREYRGPCPFCQTGHDRFAVWPAGGGDNLGRFNCKVCGRNGDSISYVQQRHGLDFIGAVRYLEGSQLETSQEKPLQRHSEPQLSGDSLHEWQTNLDLMSQKALACLMESETAAGARAWLAGRGISADEIAHMGLGYNDKWRTIIPDYKLPPGVLLPRWNDEIEITAVNVYLSKEARATTGKRRMYVKGSQPKAAMFNGWRADTAETVVIFEGELDAVLFARFYSPRAYPKLVSVATGGATMLPEDCSGLAGKRVVIVPDNDTAGADFAAAWLDLLPGAAVAHVPAGKDLTDCYKAGWNVTQGLQGVLDD